MTQIPFGSVWRDRDDGEIVMSLGITEDGQVGYVRCVILKPSKNARSDPEMAAGQPASRDVPDDIDVWERIDDDGQ